MRYAIFSDIHSNLEAFEEFIKFYKQEKIDHFIFLGDIVGYGANPKEVVSLLRNINPVSIAGNHDWAAVGKLSTESFNEYAEEAIVWTKKIITEKEINYINTFPLTHEENNFFCVHGTLNDPQDFNYLSGINEARVNFSLLKKQILFVGHSHKTQIYCANSGGIFFHPQSEVTIKNNEKYIINVGSIGQPRDRDRRLSFCIYDTEEKLARIVRLDYNIAAAAEKIVNAGLPAMLSSRLFYRFVNDMENLEAVKKEIESLREKIRDADYKYYVLSQPEISDKEYDDLLRRLKNLEEKNPQFLTADSPTQRVSGGILEGFLTVKHEIKMLSLDNTYSVEELKDWETKIKRILKGNLQLHYVVEPKVDGVSCSLIYKSGALVTGATRGDGEVGEDVTANIRTIKSIPLKLIGQNIPELLEVRGEIYMDKKELEMINKVRLKNGEQLFANPRNAASGSLKLLSPSMVAERNLECYIHSFGLAKGVSFKTHKDFFEKIKNWGLRVNPHNKFCANLDEAIDYCMKWQNKRDALSYEIDGMVTKVDDYKLREALGSTLKSPRWAVAYKFPAHQATTVVEKIEFSVGRTGIITPVALLRPVECAGVTISRSTLHNFDEIERLDVREKDTVLIERAGEVIPKIIKVIASKRNEHSKKVHVPKLCPVCKQPITKEKEKEVYWYCINPDCPAKIKQSLLHFSSRACMDIEGMGESAIEELVDRGLVKSLADIYNLKKEDLLKLPLFAEKKADNLIAAIVASKKRPFSRLIFGLGVRHIGEKAAALFAAKFSNVDELFTLKPADLEQIPEIGPVMANSIVNFFSLGQTRKLINEFKKAGLNLQAEKKLKIKTAITGKTFVFTGELDNFSRDEARALVESLGAEWSSSVSKSTDYVVVGKNPGSKYKTAEKLHLKIINEAEFKRLVQAKS